MTNVGVVYESAEGYVRVCLADYPDKTLRRGYALHRIDRTPNPPDAPPSAVRAPYWMLEMGTPSEDRQRYSVLAFLIPCFGQPSPNSEAALVAMVAAANEGLA